MRVWVTRDKDDNNGSTCIWDGEPSICSDKIFYDTIEGVSLIVCEDSKSFKRLFGFTPRKGSCKQYELSLKEIK